MKTDWYHNKTLFLPDCWSVCREDGRETLSRGTQSCCPPASCRRSSPHSWGWAGLAWPGSSSPSWWSPGQRRGPVPGPVVWLSSWCSRARGSCHSREVELPLIWSDPSSWGRRGVPAHNITVNIGTSCITRQMVLILSTFPELSGHYWDTENSLSRNTGHRDRFSVFMDRSFWFSLGILPGNSWLTYFMYERHTGREMTLSRRCPGGI